MMFPLILATYNAPHENSATLSLLWQNVHIFFLVIKVGQGRLPSRCFPLICMVSRPRNWIAEFALMVFPFIPRLKTTRQLLLARTQRPLSLAKTSSACKEYELRLFSRRVASWQQWVTQDWIYELRIGSSLSVGLHFMFLLLPPPGWK